jgi:hypothetical protein
MNLCPLLYRILLFIPVAWLLLLLLSPFSVQAHGGFSTSVSPAFFHALCCGDISCSSRFQVLEQRLGHEGRDRVVMMLVTAGVLPSAEAAHVNSCASISQADVSGSLICSRVFAPPLAPHYLISASLTASTFRPLLLSISQPTRFFPMKPCSQAIVTRLSSSSLLRLRALANPLSSRSFNISLPMLRQQLPALTPGAYVIEDDVSGCTPLKFHVSGASLPHLSFPYVYPEYSKCLKFHRAFDLQLGAATALPSSPPPSMTSHMFAAV